ncbi:PPOX class F420-dependent oxidoreductase [Streptomonospora sp. PA3]|uniref:PPOX class F420-dependent oxidoreductase n=1 Tax=Streptomonospora sp. PA3 TaxID=2607326 RepID=UPI0012DC780F|nr:PPOX class F420-dependent oxidoreductase [Streptomonospora sp. PA3]MUL40475.1 PPOX class F420-dependent oxidoreductase [Streptomonospora sp. PA3]
MSTIPADREDILHKRSFAHVATLGPRGEPQANPVWIDWDGENVRFSQTRGRQKYRNLLRDDRISMSVQDPDDPYRYVEIRGRVESIEEDDGNAFIDHLAKRYLDQDRYPWTEPGEERIVISVRPEHTTKQ